MPLFHVTADFLPADADQVAALQPQEERHVARLREEGRLRALYVAADRSMLWLTFDTDTETAARQLLADFPFARWFHVRSVTAVRAFV